MTTTTLPLLPPLRAELSSPALCGKSNKGQNQTSLIHSIQRKQKMSNAAMVPAESRPKCSKVSKTT